MPEHAEALPPLPLDIVGTTEIAMRCDVEPSTVRQWRARDQFPAPAGMVSGNPWWHWQHVVELSPMVARYVAKQRLANLTPDTPQEITP